MISLDEWRPDVADLGTNVLNTAQNVLPQGNSYGPFPSLTAITSALGATCVGAFMAAQTSGSYVVYAGTAAALFMYNQGTDTWTNVTRLVGGAYNVASGRYWSFAQFGANVVATNVNDVLQYIDVDAGTNFAAVAGSPPQAAYVRVIGDFVVLAGLATTPRRVQWSGLNNLAFWTPGSQSSDYQDFADGGDVVGVSGLESGFVIQKDAVRRMVFQPSSPAVFSFERIQGARGCFSPYSLIAVGDVTFYYSNAGFYVISGTESQPIGLDAVDEFFKSDALPNLITSMQGVADPRNTRVYWGYTSNSNTGMTFDKLIIYDWGRKKWTLAIENAEVLAASATLGYTLEGLDAFGTLETITISFDSPVWQGGVPSLGAVTTAHKFGFFTGAAKEATIETADVQFVPPRRAFASAVVPYFNASDIAVSVAGRENRYAAVSYGSESTLGADFKAPVRSSARYHRIKFRVPAGSIWTEFQGFDAEFIADGDR